MSIPPSFTPSGKSPRPSRKNALAGGKVDPAKTQMGAENRENSAPVNENAHAASQNSANVTNANQATVNSTNATKDARLAASGSGDSGTGNSAPGNNSAVANNSAAPAAEVKASAENKPTGYTPIATDAKVTARSEKVIPVSHPVVRSTARRAEHAPAAVQPRRPQVVGGPEFNPPDINNPETPRTSPLPEDQSSQQLRLRKELKAKRRRIGKRIVLTLLACLAVFAIVTPAWFFYLLHYADGTVTHVPAGTSPDATDYGVTYLIAGSDQRTHDGIWDSETQGHRADSILLVHQPSSGNPSVVSIPRDTFVELDGKPHKINATFTEGASGLVKAVEAISGMKINHYIQVGMGGVKEVVDAVGGVDLCYDRNVNDRDSGLNWRAGCQHADGNTALAFSRMRKADPLGDLGRAMRQRQVVSALIKSVETPSILLPWRQYELAGLVGHVFQLGDKTAVGDLLWAAWSFRDAVNAGLLGTPPISDLNYRPGGIGAAVRIDPQRAPQFWNKVRDGSITAADFKQN